MRPADALQLADLIDLEAQLEADRALDVDALRKRDREIGLTIPETAHGRAEGLVTWLNSLRSRGDLGANLVRGARVVAALLVISGAMFGSGAARVLMHFDGATPVNVLPILGLLVLLQIVLLLALLISVAVTHFAPGAPPLFGEIRALVRALAGKIAARRIQTGGAGARWVATLHRLRARSRLHEKLELWWLTRTAQSFGIAFNVAALAVMLWMPSVVKYSFCWSTTLELGPEALHRITGALSLPWRLFAPGAVPTLELIRSTQFDLLSSRYVTGQAPRSSAWWPFLCACVVTYGLLPRVVLGLVSGAAMRRALRRIPLDTPDVAAVFRRLRSPVVEMRAPLPTPVRTAIGPRGQMSPVQELVSAGCTVIAWRDLPIDRPALEGWLTAELGWSIENELSAGGADFEQDERTIRDAAADARPVVVTAEAYEPPDKSVRRFLTGLRKELGPRIKVSVLLVATQDEKWAPAARTDVETWTHQLAVLEDPYLAVESISR